MKAHSRNKNTFFRFLSKEISIPDFEQWIYDNPDLESEIGADIYTDLISFDFKSHDLIPFVTQIAEYCFERSEYEKWRTIILLSQINNGKIEIVLATRKLRELYLDQEGKIGKPLISIELAIGYESELDGYPIESEYHLYNKHTLESMFKLINSYKLDFLNLVKQELQKLDILDLKID